jgi:hypothetical protein
MFRKGSRDMSPVIRVTAFPEGRLRVEISQCIGSVTRDGGGGEALRWPGAAETSDPPY